MAVAARASVGYALVHMRYKAVGALWAQFAFTASLAAHDVCATARDAFQRRTFQAAQHLLLACWGEQQQKVDPSVVYELGQTYRELKNYQSGLERLQSSVFPQHSVDVFYLRGYLYFRMGRSEASIASLHEAFRRDPADWRVHQVFALNFVMLERREAAIQEFETAIRLQPQNAELHYQLSRYYYTLNRFEDAVRETSAALESAPNYTEAHSNLGLCFEAQGRTQDATREYEKAVEIAEASRSTDEWPYLNYASFLLRFGHYDKTVDLLRHAVEIAPHSYWAWLLSGKLSVGLGRYGEAKNQFLQAINLDSTEPGACYQLAMVFLKLGDQKSAKLYLNLFAARGQRRRSGP